MWTEKVWRIAQVQVRELWKCYWKIIMNFSQIFQTPGLRKINIANAESIFDQNEYNILILWQVLDNKDVSSYTSEKKAIFSNFL